MASFGITDAQSHFPMLVERALAGEEVVITLQGKPAVRLLPLSGANAMAELRGIWRGQVQIAEDFDELPDDIASAFGLK